MTKPRTSGGSAPSGDEDPTGVRALLSALPEPEPMPAHVVDRINASLAAEQAERVSRTSQTSEATVTPMLSRARGRRARVLFGAAGVAAAVALVAVVGTSLSLQQQDGTTSAAVAVPSRAAPTPVTEGDGAFSGPAVPDGPTPGGPQVAAAPAGGGAAAQLRLSSVQYTRENFVAQARRLEQATGLHSLSKTQPTNGSADLATKGLAPAATPAGLPGCLRAIGADRAQEVQIDVSTYEGMPAVVIVATTNGKTLAYAVGPQCGPTKAFLLHPAVVIPPP